MSANITSHFESGIRVLMLGWEFPPRFAGGLGKACQGLSQAMARAGAQIYFVLPTYPKRYVEEHLQVVGARELLIESGWESDWETNGTSTEASQTERTRPQGQVTAFNVDAKLYPYGKAPRGEIPKTISSALGLPAFPKLAHPRIATASREHFSTITISKEESREIYGSNMWSEIERYCFAVRQLAKNQEVDVVHAHDWMSFPPALEYQRLNPGVPVFLHVHATEYDRSGENVNTDVFRIEREGFKKATHIFAVSRYTAGVIERLYGIPREKISVVYNAPDEDAKKLIAPPESNRSPQVVFLGRLTFQKGPDHFLQAAKHVIDQAPKKLGKIQFVFCGTGDMLDKLRAQSFHLGIEDRVHFAGFVEPRDVDRILLKSRVLVMPSVSEPFGLVALEAIHCGIPVILSKQSGVREVLHRALQVDFWDHEKLADQILAALRLKALSKQLVNEGMEQIRALSWEKSAITVLNSYRRFL